MFSAKFSMPSVGKNVVNRERLLEKLRRIPDHRVTSVVAPAGYGKTTAVSSFLETSGISAAWLSLDACDNNPAVFWRYVSVALDAVVPGVSKDTEYVFSSPDLMNANTHVNILIDRLSGIEPDFLFVLDDLHFVSDPAVIRGLSVLIDYMPSRMRLVLISRSEPAVRLAKHEMAGQVLRVDEGDLRFDEDEIRTFYGARGYALGNDDVRSVESYSEGWAAALVAVAMSMDHERSSSGTVSALGRSSRDIGEYLRDEVVSAWQPEKLDFAVKTCILDTLSEAVCNAVTGGSEARRMLKEISAGSGFLSALDGQGDEYRYHPLFRSFLLDLLSDMYTGQTASLHMRAARWYEERGFVPQAIGHMLDAGTYREAFELIERRTDYLIHQGDFNTLLPWLKRLPKDLLDESFQAAFVYATYYSATGRHDLSRQWLDAARGRAAGERYAKDPEWSAYIRTECDLVEATFLARVGSAEFLRLVLSATSREDRSFMIPKYFDFNTGDVSFSRCPFGEIVDIYGENPDRYETVMTRYRKLLSVKPGYHPLIAGEYLYERNRLEEALPYFLNALEEARTAGCAGALVPATVHLSRIRWAENDMPGALRVLEESSKDLLAIGKPHWGYLVDAFRCRLDIESGATEKVQKWFSSRKFGVYSAVSAISEFELIVYCRALVMLGSLNDAGVLLQRLLSFAHGAGRLHSEAEILNLLSLLSHRKGDMSNAMGYLTRALTIGAGKGWNRSFLDEGPAMADLLRYFLSRRSARGRPYMYRGLAAYAKRLLLCMRDTLGRATPGQPPKGGDEKLVRGIDNLLTPQERKVLRLLANANTNAEIGQRLGIGLRTVKTHTGNIYSKLGVKNRAQCAKLAREMNLL